MITSLYGGDYKKYLIVPALFFIAMLALIFIAPGIEPGIDIKGGTNIIVRAEKPLDPLLLRPLLEKQFSLTELQISSVSSPNNYGLFIQFAEETNIAGSQKLLEEAKSALKQNPANAKSLAAQSISLSSKFTQGQDISSLTAEQSVEAADTTLRHAQESFQLKLEATIRQAYGLGDDIKFQKREIKPSLGESFFSLGLTVTLIGFILVVIVIFVSFREFIPSVAIIAALIFDIAGALGGMSVFRIPLSLATIPALLMMIGYSVDTDILLTTRVLKRKEGLPGERAHEAMITGLTMTFATLAALIVMITLSYLGQLQVIFDISAVLIFGLLADIIATWLMNAPVLLWYVESRGERK